jgi:membrane protease subunit (stomatin/prohibitin family)
MGLRKVGEAVKGFGSELLSDQFASLYVPDESSADGEKSYELMVRGVKKERNKPLVKGGTQDYIVTGSAFNVPMGWCCVILEDGAIREMVNAAAPESSSNAGQYVFESASSPSIFGGNGFKDTIKNGISDAFSRFKFNGQVSHVHRILYINMRPIIGIPVGVGNIPFLDPTYKIRVQFGLNGMMQLQTSDPMTLFANVLSVGLSGNYSVKSETGTALMKSIKQKITAGIQQNFEFCVRDAGVTYCDQVAAFIPEIAERMKPKLDSSLAQFGLAVSDIDSLSIELTEESNKRLMQIEKGSSGELTATVVERQLDAMNTAAGNKGGSMMGFAGLNMAGTAIGGMGMPQMNQGLAFPTPPAQTPKHLQPQQPAAPAPEQAAVSCGNWTCECGTANTTKFCGGCGKPQPAPTSNWTCECGTVNTTKFCGGCGKPQPASAVKCLSCGWTRPDSAPDMKFCGECGTPLNVVVN